MLVQRVALRFPQGSIACLPIRELTGLDEQCIGDISTATAISLLDRLVEGVPEGSWRAGQLTACDRDRLLAAVYRLTYGQRIDTASRCAQCGNLFDLTFLLDDLLATVDRAPSPKGSEALADGTFRTAGGIRFRLPTGEDELAATRLQPEEAEQWLFQRCLLEAPSGVDARAVIEEALEKIAPVLDLNIDTACPECGAKQVVRFDIQFYLLRALVQERAQIAREIHRIASTYGWSLQEVLSLVRSDRRLFVGLIESEMSQQRRPQ